MTEPQVDLAALKARAEELHVEWRQAADEYQAALKATAPYQPGDRVRALQRAGYLPAVVVEVKPMGGSDFWYGVSFLKKDGTPSRIVVQAFSDVRPIEADQ